MDAARSALALPVRLGHGPVSPAGRADMPAQREEVEAARTRGDRDPDGRRASTEVVGRSTDPDRYCASSGRRPPASRRWPAHDLGPVPDSATELAPARRVLVAIGEEPIPSILPVGAGIEIGAIGGHRRPIHGRSRPATPGVFAGGDVVSGPKTIIDAVAAGRRAAGAIHEYLGRQPERRGRGHGDGPLPDAAETV